MKNLLQCATLSLVFCVALDAFAGTAPERPVDVLPFSMEEPQRKALSQQPSNRFAEAFEHRITAASHGMWRAEAHDGYTLAIWEYAARIPGAVSMSTHIDRIVLPGGAHLRVENAEGQGETFYEGSLRHRDDLWTGAVPGDTLYMRIEVPEESMQGVVLETRRFHGGFRDLPNTMPRPSRGGESLLKRTTTLDPAVNNYRCHETPENKPISRAAAHITIRGTTFCSAALVNHPQSEETPYLLTAGHCSDGYRDEPIQEVAESVVASFQKLTPCGDEMFSFPPDKDSRRAIASIYHDPPTEFAGDYWLLQLESYPSPDVSPYLAGYDGITEPVSGDNGRAVHHQGNTTQQWFDAPFELRLNTGLTDSDTGEAYRISDYYIYDGPVGGGASGASVYNDSDRIVGVISAASDSVMFANPLNDAMDRGLAAHFGDARTRDGRDAPDVFAPLIEVSGSASPITPGDEYTVSWTSTGAVSCEAAQAWSGPLPLQGSRTLIAENTTSELKRITHTVSCTSDQGATASSSVAFLIDTAAPTVSFAAQPRFVESGGSSTLNWEADNAESCTASEDWTGDKPTMGSESVGPLFTGLLTDERTYTYTLTCSNGVGTTEATTTVEVGPIDDVELSLSAPASVNTNESFTVSWNAEFADTCTASEAWDGSRPINGSEQFSYASPGTRTFTMSCDGAGESDTRSVTVEVIQPDPVTLSLAAPDSAQTGESFTLSWTTTNADSCTASGDWSGTKPTSGSDSFTFNQAGARTFTLVCEGEVESATRTETVNVVAPEAVQLSLNGPSEVATGEPFNLTWTASNADNCTASGDWSGAKPTSGSDSFTFNQAGARTFTLSCDGPGESATKSATVNVAAPPDPAPIISMQAPATVETEEPFTLTYSTQNANSCTASGAWSGTRATSGSPVFTLSTSGSRTFALSCTGPGGSTSESVTVNVIPGEAPPQLDLQASPSTIEPGQSATLAWSTNQTITACTASGDWAGSRAPTGSTTVAPSEEGVFTYTMTCRNGSGETVTRSSSLTVRDDPSVGQNPDSRNSADGGGSFGWGFLAFAGIALVAHRRRWRHPTAEDGLGRFENISP